MKTRIALGTLCASLLLTPAYANSIDWNSTTFIEHHWDIWVFKYDPASGWSSTLGTGNASRWTTGYFVHHDNLPDGAEVPLLFTLRISLGASIDGGGDGNFLGEEWPTTNFEGLGSSEVSAVIGTTVFSASLPSGFGSSSRDIVVSRTGRVGENLGFLGWNIESHASFIPQGLTVLDPETKAGVQVYAFAVVSLKNIEFAPVPDSGSAGALLALGMISLCWLRLTARPSRSRRRSECHQI